MNQENNKKEVTLDDLAMMVQGGFDEVYERMATKDDLKQMVTKEDAKNFATKGDLELLATKQDLQGLRSEMNTKFGAIQEDVAEIKTELAQISKRTKEDTDAYGVDIVQMKGRIVVLERKAGIATQ